MIGPSIRKSPVAPKKERRPILNNRLEGVVKQFNVDRGFGFIGVKGHRDHFFHISAALDSDSAYLMPGDRVEIETGTDSKGRCCATYVRLI
ncbi:hypothetical protein BSK49_03790 [Paenibacillus odorifer]|nr:hypothetical protein BSK49_03790 [Paenibacillus odorifer]